MKRISDNDVSVREEDIPVMSDSQLKEEELKSVKGFIRLISGDGENVFVDDFTDLVKGRVNENDYTIISSYGRQSIGKSTLLNYLFGTDFKTMAGEGRQAEQCTKGILSNLPCETYNCICNDIIKNKELKKLHEKVVQQKKDYIEFLRSKRLSVRSNNKNNNDQEKSSEEKEPFTPQTINVPELCNFCPENESMKNVILLDLEGSDSRNREVMEKKLSLFSFVVSDVMIMNVHFEHWDTPNASGENLLRRCIQLNFQLFMKKHGNRNSKKKVQKKILLWVIRDTVATELGKDNIVKGMDRIMEQAWAGINKGGFGQDQKGREYQVWDFFEQRVCFLTQYPSYYGIKKISAGNREQTVTNYTTQLDKFVKGVNDIRNRYFTPSNREYVLKKRNDDSRVNVSDLGTYLKENVWEVIMKAPDINERSCNESLVLDTMNCFEKYGNSLRMAKEDLNSMERNISKIMNDENACRPGKEFKEILERYVRSYVHHTQFDNKKVMYEYLHKLVFDIVDIYLNKCSSKMIHMKHGNVNGKFRDWLKFYEGLVSWKNIQFPNNEEEKQEENENSDPLENETWNEMNESGMSLKIEEVKTSLLEEFEFWIHKNILYSVESTEKEDKKQEISDDEEEEEGEGEQKEENEELKEVTYVEEKVRGALSSVPSLLQKGVFEELTSHKNELVEISFASYLIEFAESREKKMNEFRMKVDGYRIHINKMKEDYRKKSISQVSMGALAGGVLVGMVFLMLFAPSMLLNPGSMFKVLMFFVVIGFLMIGGKKVLPKEIWDRGTGFIHGLLFQIVKLLMKKLMG